VEIVEAVITKEQRRVLQMNKKKKEKIVDFDDILKITVSNIDKAAFKRMKDVDEKTASMARPTITGLDNRYTKYCDANGIEPIKLSHMIPSAPAKQGTIKNWFGTVMNALSPGHEKRR
jgi:hypothetical protein